MSATDTRPISGTMHWFGRRYNAPAWETAEETAMPIGMECMWCAEPIAEGDSGITIPYLAEPGWRVAANHIECWLRQVMGSVDHLEHRCSCYKDRLFEHHEPPSETRADAQLVLDWLVAKNPSFLDR